MLINLCCENARSLPLDGAFCVIFLALEICLIYYGVLRNFLGLCLFLLRSGNYFWMSKKCHKRVIFRRYSGAGQNLSA
jgi:hypothetical protein